MDRKTLVKALHQLFCDQNKEEKKYSKVWLSDVDFGGMYQTNKYVLNIIAEHEIDNCNDEIIAALHMLNDKAKEELKFIHRVNVHHSNEDFVCESDDIMIYEEDNACP